MKTKLSASKIHKSDSSTSTHKALDSKKYFHALIEHSSDAIALINPVGKVLYASASTKQILGYTQKEFVGMNGFALVHKQDLPKVMKELSKILLHKGSTVVVEVRVKHKKGYYIWVEAKGTNLLFDKNVGAIVANFRDITERKNTEEKLKANEEQFRLLLEHSADAITLIDKTGKRIYSTPSRKNILGYDTNDDIGESVFTNIHPDDVNIVKKNFSEVAKYPNKSLSLAFRIKHKKGHWVWIETTGTNLLHVPHIEAIVVNYRDITKRKEDEERNKFLEQASNILGTSIDYEVTLKNIAELIVPRLADYCRIVTVDENKIIKEIAVKHVNPKKQKLVRELYKNYKDGVKTTHGVEKMLQTGKSELMKEVNEEILEVFKDSPQLIKVIRQLGLISYMGVPMKIGEKIVGTIVFSSVQKERLYTQEDLRLAEELARRAAYAVENARLYTNEQKAVKLRDEFISIASHELKTPITSLKLYTEILQRQLDKQSELSGATQPLEKMQDQINKLTALINDLLNVSRIESGKLIFNNERFSLMEVIKETVEIVQSNALKHRIIVKGTIDKKVYGDRYRIYQVLANLLLNAIKYSPNADEVIVHVMPGKKEVTVAVQDFGIGIDEKQQHKIFNRFYRVDNPQEKTFPGLGLGLYISNEIIKRHGSVIHVVSNRGSGSEFSFTLPYAEKMKLN